MNETPQSLAPATIDVESYADREEEGVRRAGEQVCRLEEGLA